MNPGLMLKALRETLLTTLLLGLGLFILEAILGYVLPTFSERLSVQWAQLPIFQTLIKAIVGADTAGGIGPEIFSSLGWVHPVALALTWAHAAVVCTRIPCGEIDRGTIDILLGLPVSRWTVLISETIVWFASSFLLIGLAFIGAALGRALVQSGIRPSLPRMAISATNLWSLYLAVGSLAWLISAASDRRGRAIGWLLLIVLTSFLVNYLAQLWDPARRVWFLSILRYHRPVEIMRTGRWPLRDIAILTATAAALWSLAGILFARRDLSTV